MLVTSFKSIGPDFCLPQFFHSWEDDVFGGKPQCGRVMGFFFEVLLNHLATMTPSSFIDVVETEEAGVAARLEVKC